MRESDGHLLFLDDIVQIDIVENLLDAGSALVRELFADL
ncbi:hypothetical protein SDC9_212009 [bioreactor metagenome]|uniref:Uncharacterized protein n=1 Tax=bioreactor metagenome TaxID=1076179 RepID=A0A645JKN4_9ZZZZ